MVSFTIAACILCLGTISNNAYIYIIMKHMWAEPATIKVVKPWKWLMKPWNVVQTRYNQRSPEILQIWHSWLVQWTQRYQPTKRREGPLFGDLKTDHPGPRYAPMPMLSWSFLMVLSLPTQYFFVHVHATISPWYSHSIPIVSTINPRKSI